MRASWRQAASMRLRTMLLVAVGVVSACALDRTGYLAVPGAREGGAGLVDARADGPRMDAGMPVVPEGDGGLGPRDARPIGPGDLGPAPDARPMDPRDLGRPDPPDLGRTDPPDLGPMDPPDLGPMEPPDLGPMEPPDMGPSVSAEERCDARYGDLDGYVLCFATESECGFNVTLVGDCTLSCFSRGGICLRAYDNPNGSMRECENDGEETCETVHTTEICVCTSF